MSSPTGTLSTGGGSHRRSTGMPGPVALRWAAPAVAGLFALGRRVATAAVNLLLLAAVAAFLVLGVGPHTGAYRTQTMLTGSMAPGIPVGSVVFTSPVPTGALRVGDVVTMQAPVADHHVVTHRVIAISHPGGQFAIQTKGDANVGPDPWVAKISDSRVWVVRTVIPGAGQTIRALRGPTVHRITVFGLPAFVVCWLLWGVWRGNRGAPPH